MILPLSDAPNPRGVPYVTYALLVLNVTVYLLWTLPLSQQRPSLRDPMLAEYVRTVRQALPAEVPLEVALRGLSAYDLFVFKHGFQPGAPEAHNRIIFSWRTERASRTLVCSRNRRAFSIT